MADSTLQPDTTPTAPHTLSEPPKPADTKPLFVEIKTKAVDPWATLYDNLRKPDEHQCETWKDEVANLLILAGLFSAVVTAFVIETYRTLSPDPNDKIINLLTMIAAREGNATSSNNSLLSASGNLTRTQFSPTATSVRVNIFFFISLVLSLGTALIGIVCLQWIRQHVSYPERLSPEQRVALLNMRITALQRWKVHVIITSLPVLLQLALVMFFVGLIDFVGHIDLTVIIPVGALVAVILLFLILTTMLPTLQLFFLHHAKRFINDGVPVECPYKSPQAAAFCLLITSSQLVFTVSSALFLPLYYILAPCYHIPTHLCLTPTYLYRAVKSINTRRKRYWSLNIWQFYRQEIYGYCSESKTIVEKSFKQVVLSQAPSIPAFKADILCKAGPKDGWDSFDESWIAIRDKYFRYRCSSQSWLYQTRNRTNEHTSHYYDAMFGLRRLVMELRFSIEDDLLRTATFSCIQAPTWIPHGDSKQMGQVDEISIFKTRNQYLSNIMQPDGAQSTISLSDILSEGEELTEEMLMDESICIFLDLVKSSLIKNAQTGGKASRQLSKEFAVSQLRLINSLYKRRLVLKQDALRLGGLDIPLVVQPSALFATPEVDQTNQSYTYQWAVAVHSFFKLLNEDFNSNFAEPDWNMDFNPSTPSTSDSDFFSEDYEPESGPNTNTFIAHPVFQSLLSNFCKEIGIWCDQSNRGQFYECTIKECTEGLEFIANTLEIILNNMKPKNSPPRSHRLFLCASYYVYRICVIGPRSPELMNAAEKAYAQLKLYKECVWHRNPVKIKIIKFYECGKISNTTWDLFIDSYYELFSDDWWEEWDCLSFLLETERNRNLPSCYEGPAEENIGNRDVEKSPDDDNITANPTMNEDKHLHTRTLLGSLINRAITKPAQSKSEPMGEKSDPGEYV